MTTSPYGDGTLPKEIRSRMIHGVNGLEVHILEAGHEIPNQPLALLLHGFPDLAYGWRHLMPLLAAAGYHVVAPDQRGFGRTTGADNDKLESFGILNMTRDALALVSALGYRRTTLLVGHDLGSPVASYCALARPDVFPALVLMCAPFPGPPQFPFDTANHEAATPQSNTDVRALIAALAALDPPRAFYQQYLSTPQASDDMSRPPQGMHAFLRSLFYVKSADWPGNKPHPLKGRTAADLAVMPTYYVMDLGKTMPETVAPFQAAAGAWLTDQELGVYADEYTRTGFEGPLQAYRVYASPTLNAELRLFSGKTIDVPSLFISGTSDWGTYSAPGALELMRAKALTRLSGVELIEGAGHWVQQEQPARLAELLLASIKDSTSSR